MAKWPAIQDPAPTVESLATSVKQLKEGYELLTGQLPNSAGMAVDARIAAILREIEDLKARLVAGGL